MASDTLVEKGNPISGNLAEKVRFCRTFNRPIMVFGPPGAGKSQQIHQAADDDDLVIDCRLTSLESIDMRGLPIIKKNADTKHPEAVVWVRPEFLPGDEGVVVDGRVYKKGILFLDEINTAQIAVQAPALQLVLDRKVGPHRLGAGWYIAAAGNRAEDGCHVNPMSAALLDRFAIYDYTPSHQTWTEWAIKNAVHDNVVGFISFSPSSLLSPRRDEYSPSSNPRSWCFVSDMLKTGVKPDVSDVRACVGSQASEFMAYVKVCASLPNIARLIEGKEEFKENKREISVAYAVSNAVASHLMNHSKPLDVLDNCVRVIAGISPEPASLFYRRMMFSAPDKIKTALFKSKEVTKWIEDNKEILHGAITVT
jgi:hypothetical protein